jgi:hypothetical protein
MIIDYKVFEQIKGTDNKLNNLVLQRIGIDDKFINAGSTINCLEESGINYETIIKFLR